jgi:hypothetical protein
MTVGLVLLGMMAGCGGDARVDLSAADGIRAAADQMELALQEYHKEVSTYDDSREASVVSAFVARLKADRQDDAAIDGHAVEFAAALGKIRKDRDVEYARQAAAGDNVAVLRELARGLERLGIESLTLQDEVKRYLTSWLEVRRRAESATRQQTGGIAQ